MNIKLNRGWVFLVLSILISLQACTDSSEDLTMLTHDVQQVIDLSDISASSIGWSENDIESFRKMQAINDKLIAIDPTSISQPNDMIEALNYTIVLGADVRGFREGFLWGLSINSQNPYGVLKAWNYGVFYSTLYSLCAYLRTLNTTVSNLPSNYITGYRLLENATATVLLNNVYPTQNEINTFTTTYVNSSERPGCLSPISCALQHNAIAREYLTYQGIINTSKINKIFSSTDLTNIHGSYGQYIYNNIGTLYNGGTPQTSFPTPYMTHLYVAQTIKLYLNGLNKLNYKPYSQVVKELDMLCAEYSNIVEENSNITEEIRTNLITNFHIAPASLMLWRSMTNK